MTGRGAKRTARAPFAVVSLLGTVALASGCADVSSDALQQDVAQLRYDVNALRASTQRSRLDAEAISQLDRKTREESAQTTRQLSALSSKLDGMSAELGRVSSRLDDMSRRVDTLSRQPLLSRPPSPPVGGPAPPPVVPTPPGSPFTTRAAPVPAAPAPPAATQVPAPTPPAPTPPPAPTVAAPPPAPAPAPAPPAAAPSVPAPPRVAAVPPPRPGSGATAEEAYQAAYLDFSRGRYELALSGFREFLRRYPDSPLADSAQYGIGESYYSLASAAAAESQPDKATRALEQSVQEFRKVIVMYPRGAKVPTALYKEALALAELKQTALARTRLQYLLDHFPQSEEAPLAKERLAALK